MASRKGVSTRSDVDMRRLITFCDDYRKEHGRDPFNIEIAAYLGKSPRTVVRWKGVSALAGLARWTRECVSHGRSRLETASKLVVDWEKANARLSTFAERLAVLRRKTRSWLNSAGLLRCAILSNQRDFIEKESLPALPLPVVRTSPFRRKREKSIFEASNERFDQRRFAFDSS